MPLLFSAITWRSVLSVLTIISLAFVLNACVSSIQLCHQITEPSSEDSVSSRRAVTLESRFNWSE